MFWPLFRGLNALCFMMALAGRTVLLGLPVWARALAAIVLAASVALSAFRVLGRDNSYGAQDRLVTRGLYRWTRNPQNAMLMLVYGALAITAKHAPSISSLAFLCLERCEGDVGVVLLTTSR